MYGNTVGPNTSLLGYPNTSKCVAKRNPFIPITVLSSRPAPSDTVTTATQILPSMPRNRGGVQAQEAFGASICCVVKPCAHDSK